VVGTADVERSLTGRVDALTGSLFKAVVLQPEAMRKMQVVAKNLERANYPPLHARALLTGIIV
jgi:hypothetical protein